MPQVQVALREIAAGRPVRVNDVMGYIVTQGDEETKSLPAPKRAYKFQDVIKPNSELQPDIEYYLYKQIYPPIERLCAPIPGTDSVRLAECLGLDTRKYAITSTSAYNASSNEIHPLESQIPDSIRFKDAARFSLRCRACKSTSTFLGPLDSAAMLTSTGLICSSTSCATPFSAISVTAQLEAAIRAQTSSYYESWLVCDEATCHNRTRSMSVYGHRCLGPNGKAEGCLGRMEYEYGEKRLYNQLLYLKSLFDVDRVKKEVARQVERGDVTREVGEKVKVACEINAERLDAWKIVVDAYLRKCGRVWVDMGGVFGYALK